MSAKVYDIYIVGLGGQGVLTIGELLAHATLQKGWPVNFYPTKGMSQRGGFTQGQLRIGRTTVGSAIPPQGADLIISMERSEALKGIRFAQKGTDFLLYDLVWPTSQMLMGQAKYPELADVQSEIKATGSKLITLSDKDLPLVNGVPVYANMFILGSVLKNTTLAGLFSYDEIVAAMRTFFDKGLESNLTALEAGFHATVQ